MFSYCLHETLSLVIKEKQQTCRTFVHPYTRGDNNTMGTSIKQSVGQIAVLVENMGQKGLEFRKFDFSQMFLCWCHRPVEVPYTGFPPPPNDFASFFFGQFGQYFLNFLKDMIFKIYYGNPKIAGVCCNNFVKSNFIMLEMNQSECRALRDNLLFPMCQMSK